TSGQLQNSNWTVAALNTALDGYAVASSYVPYTGATTDLNMGAHGLLSNNVTDSALTSGYMTKAGASGILANSNWTEAQLNTALDGYVLVSSEGVSGGI